ncbi:hypothetical protein BFP70_11815 [Thioclava sp. SK-1]|uniref:hypothetical protein n=1 Tax=Thioclava sp. SK-1 TaxID=1889770 RepID=UPI000826EF9B|nr:hypothetical protein [Thioclava sp. SK-1]OCX63777.1 hypothetical protein BFP70_11815 [Thioclava sp. SK-1]
MKHIFPSIAASILGLASPACAETKTGWTVTAFDMPESAIFDAAHNRIVLSVIGGHPGQADGNGHLALMSPDGVMLNREWITGLDAPKGMAIIGNTLLVADLTRLHEVDLTTGTLTRSLKVPGADFLNDITSDGALAYVSDFLGNRIWQYQAGEMRVWLEDAALSHPNGVLLDGSRLVVASWGQGMHEDFSTDAPGALLAVDLETQSISTIAPDLGNLDGVARAGNMLLTNDWNTGALFTVAPNGTHQLVNTYPVGLADISVHDKTLFLPSMLEGSLTAQTYP